MIRRRNWKTEAAGLISMGARMVAVDILVTALAEIKRLRTNLKISRDKLKIAATWIAKNRRHDYKCSANRGLESECHCGINTMLASLTEKKKR